MHKVLCLTFKYIINKIETTKYKVYLALKNAQFTSFKQLLAGICYTRQMEHEYVIIDMIIYGLSRLLILLLICT